MDEQSNQGNAIETPCRYCGGDEAAESTKMRADHYQVIVACIACGNDFAAISRN